MEKVKFFESVIFMETYIMYEFNIGPYLIRTFGKVKNIQEQVFSLKDSYSSYDKKQYELSNGKTTVIQNRSPVPLSNYHKQFL